MTIRFTRGNLLEAPAEALVNTVNEAGVMGKGIALMFREAFPENTRIYTEAAKAGDVRVGRMLVTTNPGLFGPRWIINFPTKRHWRNPSRLNWIREGLGDLARVIRERGIASVALPPLGCGSGGLSWSDVRPEIEAFAAGLRGVDVLVYEPTPVYQNTPKTRGVEGLTPARALLLELMRRYAVLDMTCSNLEVQKLAWFIHRAAGEVGVEDPLRLRFKAHRYGPYADALRHLLNQLDGSYLHSPKRVPDAVAEEELAVDPARLPEVEAYLAESQAEQYRAVLDRAGAVIEGFESPFGMELLATVDWIRQARAEEPTLDEVRVELSRWPGSRSVAERKLQLFDDDMLAVALERLRGFGRTPARKALAGHA